MPQMAPGLQVQGAHVAEGQQLEEEEDEEFHAQALEGGRMGQAQIEEHQPCAGIGVMDGCTSMPAAELGLGCAASVLRRAQMCLLLGQCCHSMGMQLTGAVTPRLGCGLQDLQGLTVAGQTMCSCGSCGCVSACASCA